MINVMQCNPYLQIKLNPNLNPNQAKRRPNEATCNWGATVTNQSTDYAKNRNSFNF